MTKVVGSKGRDMPSYTYEERKRSYEAAITKLRSSPPEALLPTSWRAMFEERLPANRKVLQPVAFSEITKKLPHSYAYSYIDILLGIVPMSVGHAISFCEIAIQIEDVMRRGNGK